MLKKDNALFPIIVLSCLFLVLVSCGGGGGKDTASKTPLISWAWRNPVPQGNDLLGITYGNGIFVAVGERGSIVTSSDGSSWTIREAGERGQFRNVAFGNGVFVIAGDTVVTSPDDRGPGRKRDK